MAGDSFLHVRVDSIESLGANTYADALEARQARKNGSMGRDADEVIAEMERIAEGAGG